MLIRFGCVDNDGYAVRLTPALACFRATKQRVRLIRKAYSNFVTYFGLSDLGQSFA
jgi:hypothetical protein